MALLTRGLKAVTPLQKCPRCPPRELGIEKSKFQKRVDKVLKDVVVSGVPGICTGIVDLSPSLSPLTCVPSASSVASDSEPFSLSLATAAKADQPNPDLLRDPPSW